MSNSKVKHLSAHLARWIRLADWIRSGTFVSNYKTLSNDHPNNHKRLQTFKLRPGRAISQWMREERLGEKSYLLKKLLVLKNYYNKLKMPD
jgi:hypothetical protein